ncbi:MAG: Fe-S-containing hydro-lyase [Clostridiales bacterium]|nr:Fe-S-containing hydro-lyase [Clostridiales bacterium]
MNDKIKKLVLPACEEDIMALEAGDTVLISGTIYTARDAAHIRMAESVAEGRELPFDVNGAGIYYLGPAPAKEGEVIGPAGPTSSYRMDKHTPMLLDRGLKVMIGKGRRNEDVKASIVKNRAVYFAATGGAAALLAKCITACEVIAYEDLGTEAVRKLELKDLPATVAVDAYGRDLYETGPAEYLKAQAEC